MRAIAHTQIYFYMYKYIFLCYFFLRAIAHTNFSKVRGLMHLFYQVNRN